MGTSMRHAHGYAAYLNGPEWRKRRLEALRLANGACGRCGETEQLEVHHLSYERLGFERPQDLVVLCNPCHAAEHGRAAKNDRVVSVAEAGDRAMEREIELERLEDAQAAILAGAR